MNFAEFHPGQEIRAGPVTLSESDIIAFAQAWDPQWFHTDPVRAAQSRWGDAGVAVLIRRRPR